MAETIHVRRIEALLDLKRAVTRFADGARDQVSRLRSILARRVEMVGTIVQLQRRKVAELESFERAARQALERCQAQPVDEDRSTPDCSEESRAVHDAQSALAEARDEFDQTLSWRRTLQNEAAGVERCLRRIDELSTVDAPEASRFLGNAHRRLQNYIWLKPDAALLDLLRHFEHQVSASQVKPIRRLGQSRESVDPSVVTGGTQDGVVFVDVADLPMPDGIRGQDDFKKIPMGEMKDGLRRLQEMTPTLLGGEEVDGSFWRKLDEEQGRPFSTSYQRIFEAFYGEGRIRVERNGSRYTIINGRHRIWLAKALGLRQIPIDLVDHSDIPDKKENAR